MMNERVVIKKEAQSFLHRHYWYNLKLFLLAILTYGFVSYTTDSATDNASIALIVVILLLSIINFFVTISTNYVSLDNLRADEPTGDPIGQQVESLQSKYIVGVIVISILMFIYTTLWTFVFIIPGIVKTYSYAQALNLYKDSVDAGRPLGYNEAITESRTLMNGHKADLFILQLSFILWGLAVVFSFGLALFYVYPYYTLATQNFYIHLLPGQLGAFDEDVHELENETMQATTSLDDDDELR